MKMLSGGREHKNLEKGAGSCYQNQRFLVNALKILKIFGETPKIFALLKIFSDQRFFVKDF